MASSITTLTLAGVVLSALAACSSQPSTESEGLSPDAEVMLAKHTMQIMRARPVQATQFGLRDEDVGARVNDAVGDYSKVHLGEWRKEVRRMLKDLDATPEQSMGSLTYAAMQDIYTGYLGDSELPFGYVSAIGRHQPYIISHLSSPLLNVPRVIAASQPAATPEEVGDYLRRLWALSPLVAGVLDTFNIDANAGFMPPLAVLEAAIASLESYISPKPEEHELVTRLVEKMDASDSLTEDDKARARNEAIAVLVRMVYPAYQNAVQNVRDRLREASATAGLGSRPLGERFYRALLKQEAGSDWSASEVHEHGLAEVARISAEMDLLLRGLGYSEGDVGERMQALSEREDERFEDSEAGREALLTYLRQVLAGMEGRLPDYFGVLPGAGIEVRPVPEFLQMSVPQAYYQNPPIGGGEPGIFWINLNGIDKVTRFSLPTLVYHEAVPGHHLQVALALEKQDRPTLWKISINGAYAEGWALYAERLAAEMGMYADDPEGDLGRLQAELFRAARLVVDTGLHTKGWDAETAVAYLVDNTGRDEAAMQREVLRYMAMPGQAVSYKLGMDGLLALRESLMTSQGESFDLKAFHDQVLALSNLSMQLLSRELSAEE